MKHDTYIVAESLADARAFRDALGNQHLKMLSSVRPEHLLGFDGGTFLVLVGNDARTAQVVEQLRPTGGTVYLVVRAPRPEAGA